MILSFYMFVCVIVKGILILVYCYEVIGVENIFLEGGVLFCLNYIDNLDLFIVGVICLRFILFMVKVELFKVFFLKMVLLKLEIFFVKCGMVDCEVLC